MKLITILQAAALAGLAIFGAFETQGDAHAQAPAHDRTAHVMQHDGGQSRPTGIL